MPKWRIYDIAKGATKGGRQGRVKLSRACYHVAAQLKNTRKNSANGCKRWGVVV